MTSISLRLPDELVGRIDKLSKQIERPRTFLIREAIEAYLEEYSDYRIALDRLLDKDDEIIASSELRRRLGI